FALSGKRPLGSAVSGAGRRGSPAWVLARTLFGKVTTDGRSSPMGVLTRDPHARHHTIWAQNVLPAVRRQAAGQRAGRVPERILHAHVPLDFLPETLRGLRSADGPRSPGSRPELLFQALPTEGQKCPPQGRKSACRHPTPRAESSRSFSPTA